KAGADVPLMPRDNEVGSMAQAILASDDLIKNNPQLIQKIVTATLKGMELIMKDTDAAVAAYVEAVPTHKGNEAQLKEIFDMYKDYVYADQKVLGRMDPKRLAETQSFYVDEGIVSKASPVEDLYTNQFVEKK